MSDATDELDAFLEAHGMTLAVAAPTKRKGQYPREPKRVYRCSCGWEGTDHGVVKGHAWKGHLYHMVNQKPWSES